MKLQKEFAVALSREAAVATLADDRILEKIFPGTRVEHRASGVRETFTPYSAFGQTREIRFLWQTCDDGGLRFEKVTWDYWPQKADDSDSLICPLWSECEPAAE